MKLYILTDLEGVCGVVNFEEWASPQGKFHEKARHLLTQEVNAAVEGALEAGATEIVVWDGHGPGAVNIEDLHPEAKLLHGRNIPRTLGLDETFSALLFVGQHARSGAPEANMPHTYSTDILKVTLNGIEIGEFGMRAVLAGHFGVPTVFISGDEAACKEAQELIPEIEAVIVKWAMSESAALCLSPEKARALIREGVRRAVERRDEIPPFKLNPPYELVIQYRSADLADSGQRYWEAQRVDPLTIRVLTEDFLRLAW